MLSEGVYEWGPHGMKLDRGMGRTDRPVRPGWEPLALAMTGVFIGLLGVIASAINSRSDRSTIPGPVWQVLTACATLAGLGAVASWVIGRARWRPAPLVDAVIGVVAVVGAPVEAVAVRPHSTLIGVEPSSGHKLWTAHLGSSRCRATSMLRGVRSSRAAQTRAPAAADPCPEVRLDPRTGQPLWAPTPVNPGTFKSVSGRTSDGTLSFSIETAGSGFEVAAQDPSGAIIWTTALSNGPLPSLAAGSGVLVIDSEGFKVPGPVTAVPPSFSVPSPPAAAMRVLDEVTGRDLWQDSSGATIGATVAAGEVWPLAADQTLVGRDPHLGAMIYRSRLSFQPASINSGVNPGCGLLQVEKTHEESFSPCRATAVRSLEPQVVVRFGSPGLPMRKSKNVTAIGPSGVAARRSPCASSDLQIAARLPAGAVRSVASRADWQAVGITRGGHRE